ncbi:hypothetical protein ACIBF1_01385 [Spirillospora sp. NPDC050679]
MVEAATVLALLVLVFAAVAWLETQVLHAGKRPVFETENISDMHHEVQLVTMSS